MSDWEPLDFTDQTRSWADLDWVETETGWEMRDGGDVLLSWDHDDLDAFRQERGES